MASNLARHVYHVYLVLPSNYPFNIAFVGFIDVDEIMVAFKGLGVTIDRSEAEKLLKRYVNCIHPFPVIIKLLLYRQHPQSLLISYLFRSFLKTFFSQLSLMT